MEGLSCLLRHPEVATRDCGDCATWQYEETGERAGQKALWRGKPMKRLGRPPCNKCPKKSPEQAKRVYELSPKNRKTVEVYHAVRATSGRCVADTWLERDPIFQRNMSICDQIIRQVEEERQAALMLNSLALLAPKSIATDTGRRK